MKLPMRMPHKQNADAHVRITPLRNTIDQFFDDNAWGFWPMMHMPHMFNENNTWIPKIDMSETDAEVHIKIDTPGVDPQQVNISVDDNILTISGNTEESREEKSENFYRMEREYGSFQRSLELPRGSDADHIEATSKNGVISISIPKKPGTQNKQIKVNIQESKQP